MDDNKKDYENNLNETPRELFDGNDDENIKYGGDVEVNFHILNEEVEDKMDGENREDKIENNQLTGESEDLNLEEIKNINEEANIQAEEKIRMEENLKDEFSQEDYQDEPENEEEKYRDRIPDDIKIENKKNTKKRKKRWRGSMMSYVSACLLAAIVGGVGSTYIAPLLQGTILKNPNTYAYNGAQGVQISTNDDINTVSAVAKKAMDSVVGITTVELKRDFFQETEVEGVGTGVIVGSDGYILTNSHVIGNGNAKSIDVLFGNGDRLPADLLWHDPMLDIALVKVDAVNLPVAELGDSDELEVGEVAVAIGNPLGLEFQRSVTSGIISGLNRSIRVSNSSVIDNLIQTDASINKGNSGGPLLNKKGQVVGINTAKIQNGEGLGFSIPINDIKPIIESVLQNGTHKTVFLGISGITVQEYQSMLGVELTNKEGVILIEVAENSPASRAGLQIGDIITEINGVKINSMQDLKKMMYKIKKGEEANLKVIRSADNIDVKVVFDEER